MEKFRLP